MKIFLGGVFPYEKEANEKAVEHRLTSYHFQKNGGGQFSPQVLLEMRENRGMVMVDSGAFSVWTKGQVIDIQEYIDWIKANLEFADYFVALDVIPGRFGKPSVSYIEKDESARKSFQNYHKMVRAGIPPEKLIHVLHFGDEIKWAERCKEFPFIGLGGMVSKKGEARDLWLRSVLDLFIDSEGYPINKWHAFGATDYDVLSSIPFYSSDTSGWLKKAVFGAIDIFDKKDQTFSSYYISDKASHLSNHFHKLPVTLREKLKKEIEKVGFTLEQLQEDNANARIGFNIQTWKMYEELINREKPYPWPMPKKRVMELF